MHDVGDLHAEAYIDGILAIFRWNALHGRFASSPGRTERQIVDLWLEVQPDLECLIVWPSKAKGL